ncbi:bifunctional nuclease family protein [Emticicia aquatilis]|nr:bifunctional nuclease family protein [Emticicia aquatilis]
MEVSVIALAESESKKGYYVLILEESKSKKRIPIITGSQEAQAIAIHLERLQPARPLTHDLFKNTITQLGAIIKEVFIHRLEMEIFHALIILQTADKKLIEIDARTSDAIALAIRFSCPIYVSESVLESAGYEIDEKGKEKKGSYAEYTLEELEELLDKILKKEDYESAARVRDAIERRKSN